MRKFFKEYFSFSLSERKGIWVLIVLIIIVITVPFIIESFVDDNCTIPDKSLISKFEKAIDKQDTGTVNLIVLPQNSFNPNLLTREEWIKMGVKKKVADNICNYLTKGGKFYKKEDLLKIYGFDTLLYNSIYQYIRLEPKPIFLEKKNYSHTTFSGGKEFNKTASIELNSADTTELNKLPGIGSVISNRIIKYRNSLGGYYSFDQLSEVYGLSQDACKALVNKITVDTSLIKKIDLNNVSEMNLKSHPYIGKYKASSIIKLRKFQKTKISSEDLFKNGIINKEEAEKLKYYLK